MGVINTDHTGSGGAITLSSDGTNLLLGGSAVGGGGGGADLYAANESSPAGQPSATGANAVAIGDSATASGADTFAIGELAIASGISALALGKSRAAGNWSIAIGVDSNAAHVGAMSQYSIAIGPSTKAGAQGTSTSKSVALGNEAKAEGQDSTALGAGAEASGSNSISIAGGTTDSAATGGSSVGIGKGKSTGQGSVNISGSDASYNAQASGIVLGKANIPSGGSKGFSVQIDSHTNTYGGTGSNSIALGYQNRASGSKSVAIGSSNQATNSFATAIGTGNYATHYASVALGRNNQSYAGYAVCLGNDNAVNQSKGFASGEKAKARTIGQFARASGGQGSAGEMQTSWFTLNCTTSDATTRIMGAENGSNGSLSTDQVFLVDDSALSFIGTVVACGPDGTKTGGWEIKGHLKNAAGTTTLPASTVTALYNPNNWAVALTAHDAHNSLRVSVTGEASLSIWWSAQIMSSEVVNN